MSAIYHEGNRERQQRYTTRIADRIEEVLVSDSISDDDGLPEHDPARGVL